MQVVSSIGYKQTAQLARTECNPSAVTVASSCLYTSTDLEDAQSYIAQTGDAGRAN